jgi:hypothetical protein
MMFVCGVKVSAHSACALSTSFAKMRRSINQALGPEGFSKLTDGGTSLRMQGRRLSVEWR